MMKQNQCKIGKRQLLLFTLAFSFLLLLGQQLQAQNSGSTVTECFSLTVDNKTVCQGESFSLPIKIGTIGNISSMKFDITYDNTKLQYNGLTVNKNNLNKYESSGLGKIEIQLYQNLGAQNSFGGEGDLVTLSFTSLSSGIFTVNIPDVYASGNEGGKATITAGTVTVATIPVVSISSSASSVCSGTSALLSASGATTYSWSTAETSPSISVAPTATTSYTVTGTTNGCNSTATTSVTVSSPVLTITNEQYICTGEQASISAGGANNYLWSNSATTAAISVSPTSTTTYQVTGKDALGCIGTASTTVHVRPYAPIQISQIPTTVNPNNGLIPLTATPVGGSWDIDGVSMASTTIDPKTLSLGKHTITYTYLTDETYCGATKSIDIVVGSFYPFKKELQKIIDVRTEPWGINVISVEVKDVLIPSALEDAMSMQAQAERERQARVILGDSERQVAEKFGEAAKTYTNNPVALHLRAMNMLYEGLKQNSTIVIVPSSAIDTMQLGSMAGLTALTMGIGQDKANKVKEGEAIKPE